MDIQLLRFAVYLYLAVGLFTITDINAAKFVAWFTIMLLYVVDVRYIKKT